MDMARLEPPSDVRAHDSSRDEPVIDDSPEGVDRTLIYHMLSLSPAGRLTMLQGFATSVWAIRNGRRPPA